MFLSAGVLALYQSSPSLLVPDNAIHKPSLYGQAMSKKSSDHERPSRESSDTPFLQSESLPFFK